MGLIAGVDSSTQSTKVEVRDAETGGLVGHGTSQAASASLKRFEKQTGSPLRDLEFGATKGARQAPFEAIV